MVGRERGRRRARTAEYRPGSGGPAGGRRQRFAPGLDDALRHPVGGEELRAGAARRRAGRPPRAPAAAPRASARRPTARRTRRRSRRARPDGCPTGVPNAGTPHASASITESPKPSSCDGTSTALAALIQYGHLVGRDAAHRRAAARRRPASRARSKRFSGRGGSCGKRRYGPAGVEAEPRARLRARDRAEALERDADGQHRDAPPRARRPAGCG